MSVQGFCASEAQLLLQMRIAWGACFFCCRLCSLLALCPWKGNDVADTLEPPNTTPGMLADLDLLEVDFLTKWRTRLFAVWRSCWFAPWCGIDAPLLLVHPPPGFEMHLVVEVAALLLWFPKWVLAGLVVCRSRAFALLCAIAPPNADCIGGLCRLLLLQVVFTSRPLPLGGTMSLTPWNHQTQYQEGLRTWTCWRWIS